MAIGELTRNNESLELNGLRRQGDSYYFDTFRLVDKSEQVQEMQPSDPRFLDAE